MKRMSCLALGLGPVIAAALVPALAVAQQAAPGDAATASAGDIVVTALRRSDSLLKTPAAITALKGDDLKTQGVNNLADVQNVAPGLAVAGGRDGLQIAIRGVTTTDTSSKGEQDIAFSVDGMNIGRGKARSGAFFDIDRVEVLRGPQGTLYGRSSTGGAVNVITNKPTFDGIHGYAKVEYGNYDAKRIEAALNVPLSDTLAVRVSGAANDRDGYSKPIPYTTTYNGKSYSFDPSEARARNDQKDATGRFSLLYKPSENGSLRLTATIGHQGGAGSAPALETQLAANHSSGSAGLGILTNPVPAFLDNNFQLYDAALNWKFGAVQLDVLGSYQHMAFRQQAPSVQDVGANGAMSINPVFGANSFGPAFQFYYQQDRVKTTQGEVRLSNAETGRIDYVAGINYYKEIAGENGQSWNALIDQPLNTGSYVFESGPVNITTHKAYGIFGQATFHATDSLSFVGGLRYTHDEIDRIGTFTLPFDFSTTPPGTIADTNGNPVCHYPDVCKGPAANGSARDNKVTWRVGINWQASPAHLFYGSIATGFKAGGFNDYDPSTGGVAGYQPEQLTAYELGYKGRPLAGLTLSSSLFFYDFSKMQVNSGADFPNGTYALYTSTTPTEIYGWENEFAYKLARETTLSGSFSLMGSKFRNYQAGMYAFTGQPIDFSGKPLDLAPGVVITAALVHAFDLPNEAKLRLRLASKYSGAYYLSDYADGVRYRQSGYTRSDLSMTYEPRGAAWSVQGFVENLENKVQRTSMLGYANSGAAYGGTNTMIPANMPANNLAFYTTTPRFYGVRLNVKF
ncbi:TonB-dependent receptor [Novosphingobium terrae]|uniref:TonB-dependent receptor n=1 Tax=Novosphingobium terrae TaxID=2726189 RepID=UPI0019812D9A|nr:TonB-dependent receptor [Novosphingobium terrae]